jgi:hypothetical protein
MRSASSRARYLGQANICTGTRTRTHDSTHAAQTAGVSEQFATHREVAAVVTAARQTPRLCTQPTDTPAYVQVHALLAEQVLQATRGGDNDVHTCSHSHSHTAGVNTGCRAAGLRLTQGDTIRAAETSPKPHKQKQPWMMCPETAVLAPLTATYAPFRSVSICERMSMPPMHSMTRISGKPPCSTHQEYTQRSVNTPSTALHSFHHSGQHSTNMRRPPCVCAGAG